MVDEFRRFWVVLAFLGAVCVLSWGVWSYGYAQALGQVAARGQADLALAADRLVTGLLRYRATAVLLVDHPVLQALHRGGDPAEAEAFLLASADRTGAALAVYSDRKGRILASSTPGALPELTTRAWFGRAVQGALGSGYDVDAGSGERSYAQAAPAFGPDGRVRGVLIMVVDLEGIEGEWRGSRPSVFFTGAAGDVIVTNRSEMLFWRWDAARVAMADGQPAEVRRREVAGHDLWRQRLSDYVPPRALHLQQPLPVVGLTARALVDVAPARRIAGLQTMVVAVLCLGFGALLWVLALRRRALTAANAALEGRVRARTAELEAANGALRQEVMEREEAEAALRRAQVDLVQAGKLSALGQMSAGISHELNQPLMAIRQFAENGGAFIERGRPDRAGENLARIAALATRAARIIRNLRAFANGESEPMGRVDLGAVLEQAVELTEVRLAAEGVALDCATVTGVAVRGGEVRLGQVFVNLINNAADAMAEHPEKRIAITVEAGARVVVRVRDTGPGISDPEKVFEPFYSTKEVGGGMGLGLSISYGLVQSFGGNIRGANVSGGAEFAVELERWSEEVAA
ncbi:sensor histidine kinase [Sagittula salina]|uniref:C4-dicarboxylate transport sensor protein DctB n=1 Tax=Sagittula salina TaxID=2820268 RepID=A0A940MQL8_9RHOB|nr:ATP-binding protein [Sagittula salina]MBP0482986.1 sensor histidine kinase [Sagittula salina]